MSGSGKKRPPLVADRRYPASAGKTKKTTTKRTAKSASTAKTSRRKPARKKSTRKRNPIAALVLGGLGWVLRLTWRLGLRAAAIVALLVGLGVGYFYTTLPPDAAALVDGRVRGSVTMLDRDGKIFAWRGDQFGGMITADTVSPHLKNAVVATEDKRFYRHLGLSPRGIASAVRINLSEGRGPLSGHGGSTITQQTAKLLCLGVPYDPDSGMSEAEYEADCREGSLWRKIKEGVYALAMEARYSKDEILTIYLNRAFLGAGARGFEAASERYFGKSANEVNPAQAAMLAGLLKAPSRYAPTSSLQRAQDRALTVLKLMEEQGYLSAAEAAHARENPATLSKAAEARAGGYFADWIMSSAPSYLTRETTEDVVIRTTLDQRLQKAAEEAMLDIFANKVREGSEAQAAIVVMSADGAVRAMVGGRQVKVSGAFNRAVQAKRQTGSAFKPFVYAAALDLGYGPNDTVVDEPYCINVPGSGQYCPENYSRDYKGRVTLTQALMHSLNVPAVKISEFVGRENVRKIANDFGLTSDLALGPALALGASESTLLEMSGAYAGILNGGSAVTPYGVVELRLQGDSEPLMAQESGLGERVVTERAAGLLTYMMNQVVEGGTGQRARLNGRPAAGKTGTTQAARDAWFVGFTADYVAGVWMGYDDNTPLTGVTGGGLPAEIWRETMLRVHDGLPVHELPMIVPPRVQPAAPAQTARQERQKRQNDPVEQLLIDVLEDIFGGKRN